ncbi:hypothetical protein B0T25DRAFT_343567 [Lasiosphaeria hispida]|uniref:Uncharacterized protein n=1 Tax=Lasiosphaeria hispida TaxID=260671 RepID=A0AAJ0H6Y7_9PEZI|nr:hypothetical protein B0T25DRAFT_343567 [Lasiosphaeria hispida]
MWACIRSRCPWHHVRKPCISDPPPLNARGHIRYHRRREQHLLGRTGSISGISAVCTLLHGQQVDPLRNKSKSFCRGVVGQLATTDVRVYLACGHLRRRNGRICFLIGVRKRPKTVLGITRRLASLFLRRSVFSPVNSLAFTPPPLPPPFNNNPSPPRCAAFRPIMAPDWLVSWMLTLSSCAFPKHQQLASSGY